MARRKNESQIPSELLNKLFAGRDPKIGLSREELHDNLKRARADIQR